jgi:tetratricopeptide (TPR) repeat protein
MNLHYWNVYEDQQVAADYLKPNREDKNVSPAQMADYVNLHVPNLNALYRYAGSVEQVKRLMARGFPVLVETGFEPEDEDLGWMGHYRLLAGYLESSGTFFVFDSYLGSAAGWGMPVPYDVIDADWQHFNRVYLVVYPPDRESAVAAALGSDMDVTANAEHAVDAALENIEAVPDNPFAWFNLGTSFTVLGKYEDAALAYDEAFGLGLPWRMLWYQHGPLEAYFNTGRLDDVALLAGEVAAYTPYVEEVYYYLGKVYTVRGQYRAALLTLYAAALFNPNFAPAQDALGEAKQELATRP